MKNNVVFNFFLAMIIVTGILIRFDLKDRPLQFNEGTYAYIADKMINGGMHYLDAYDSKPPGIYYLQIFLIKLFGNSPITFHLCSVISDILIILLIFLVGTKLFGKKIGLLASATYSVLYLPFTASKGGFLEPPMMVFTLLSIFFYLKYFEKNFRLYAFASGILLALSFNIKQPAIILFLTYFLHTFFLYTKKKLALSSTLSLLLLIIVGFLIAYIPILLVLIKFGKLNEYLFSVYYSSFGYGPVFFIKMQFLVNTFRYLMPIFSIIAVVSFFYLFFKKINSNLLFIYLWLFTIIIFYIITSDFQPHYLIQIIPVMTLFAACFLYKLNLSFRILLFILILATEFVFIYSELYYYHNYIHDLSGEDYFNRMKFPHVYRAMYRVGYLREQEMISNFIKENINSTDEIITPIPTYSYLTNKTSNYRYMWINPMVSRITDTSDFPKYASRAKYFIYEIWQEDQEHISKKFLSCVKKNWKLIGEVSTWYVFVYENTNKTVCKDVW